MAIGEGVLFESYFVCITISGKNTLIEYGKNQGTRDAGNVYLYLIDNDRKFDVRFYAFGNKDEPVNIMDAHMVSHNRTDIQCKGDTKKDEIENLCAQNCHTTCNPVAGWWDFKFVKYFTLGTCFAKLLFVPCSFTFIALEQQYYSNAGGARFA